MTAPLSLPTHITIFTHEFFPKIGGIGLYVEELANALTELGCKVTVWAPRHALLDEREFAYEVRQLPVRGTQDWDCRVKMALTLWRHRDSWRHSVVHLPEPGPLRAWLYLQWLPMFRPKALVLTLHGTELEFLGRAFHRRWLLFALLRRSVRAGVVSNYVRERLVSRYSNLRTKLVLCPGAARPAVAPHMDTGMTRGSVTSENPACAILVTVGRVHPRKGQLAVVEALSQLPDDMRKRVQYRIVGPTVDSTYAEKITDVAKGAALDVVMLGELSDVAVVRELQQAHVFVMTSMPAKSSVEGFGLVYLEAGCHKLPVVAHRIGGVEDAVIDGQTGLLVEPGDRGALARAISSLMTDANLRGRLGEGGHQRAGEFSWQGTARSLFANLPLTT